MRYQKHINETIGLLRQLSKELQLACKGKVSTNDITPDRLLWHIFNKIFSILVICENGLLMKDSLTIHLIARYSYEVLIIFAYIFLDKSKIQERVGEFLTFTQFKSTKQKWTDKTYAKMLEEIPNNTRFSTHKRHYRNLSNFAHPNMDSFLLNCKGEDYEISMILSTTLLTIGTILEIIKICFEENLYFDDQRRKMLNLTAVSSNVSRLMKELQVVMIEDI